MAAQLDAAAVRHVAHLARLKISQDEVALYADQLSSILDYFTQLSAVNTEGIDPTAHPHDATNVLRDDVVLPSCSAEEALSNAPQQDAGFFRVPKVLDQETA